MDLFVGFLLGIVGAGFGVVLEQVIVGHFRDERLRRGLLSEIEENLRRIGDGTEYPGTAERSAWDAARELSLPSEIFELVARAYASGARLNEAIAVQQAHTAASAAAPDQHLAFRQEGQMGDYARKVAREAHQDFTKARAALRR